MIRLCRSAQLNGCRIPGCVTVHSGQFYTQSPCPSRVTCRDLNKKIIHVLTLPQSYVIVVIIMMTLLLNGIFLFPASLKTSSVWSDYSAISGPYLSFWRSESQMEALSSHTHTTLHIKCHLEISKNIIYGRINTSQNCETAHDIMELNCKCSYNIFIYELAWT